MMDKIAKALKNKVNAEKGSKKIDPREYAQYQKPFIFRGAEIRYLHELQANLSLEPDQALQKVDKRKKKMLKLR
jgi:hypothetical protein